MVTFRYQGQYFTGQFIGFFEDSAIVRTTNGHDIVVELSDIQGV